MLNYFKKIDGILYFILCFCLIGLLRNIFYLADFGFDYTAIPTKVFVAMIVIYGAQIVLILMRERAVCFISAIQIFFCFYVYGDYTLMPFGNAVKVIIGSFIPQMDYGWSVFTATMLASAMFSLEILKTYLLFVLTDSLPKKSPKLKEVV